MMTGLRQSLAMAICLLALELAKRRKFIWFLLLVLGATMFHKSAIIFVMVYFLVNQKLTILKSVLISITTLLCYSYLEPIQEFVNEKLDYDYGIEKTGNGQIFLLLMIFLLMVTLYKYKSNITENRDMIVLYNMQVLCTLFWVLRLVSRTVERPSYYFMFGVIALLPNTVNRCNNRKNRIVLTLVILLTLGILFVYRTMGNPMLVPYSFVWEN